LSDKFEVLFLEEAANFLDQLSDKHREKILFNIRKAKVTQDQTIFKKLTDDIWEFRTLYQKTAYRMFAFWDKTDQASTLVIATHGINKKTNKTPQKEIEKAVQYRRQYFEQNSK
jgi:phage-related protein